MQIQRPLSRWLLFWAMAGALAGITIGALAGSAFLGLVLGGFLGFKIPYEMSRKGAGSQVRMGFRFSRRGKAVAAVSLLATALILYCIRPWLHGFFMAFYTLPALTALVLSLCLSGLMLFMGKKAPAAAFSAIAAISLVLLMFNNVLVQKHIVSGTDYNRIEALPDSDRLRLLPMAVALRYIEDSLQKSRERAGPLDIVDMNNTLVWTSPRLPDGQVIYFTEKVNGLLVADATRTARSTRLVSQRMRVGEGIGILDNIYWRVYKKRFFVSLAEVYYLEDSGSIYAIAQVVGYRFRFPVMIPYFKGVFIFDSGGNSRWVDASDVGSQPLLSGNVAFPDSLARLYVDSYKYSHGWLNAVFLHRDQIEISDVYGQGNRQPFLMDTVTGLKWVIATEPYGKSYGIFKIFLVDATTGKIDMLELDEEQTLTGPVRVVSYVRKKFPMIDWATSRVLEPRPYVIGGRLYWMLSITPSDYAGVSYTVLVDSETNEVMAFDNDSELIAYVKEGAPENQSHPLSGPDSGLEAAESSGSAAPGPGYDGASGMPEIEELPESGSEKMEKMEKIREKITIIESEIEELKQLIG